MGEVTTGHASVNGVEMWWRSEGSGGVPLVVVHGGFGLVEMFGGVLGELAAHRRVIAVELQGHGRTPDVDREFTFDDFADDLAAFAAHLGAGPLDLLGYSLGGGACLRAAIRHPDVVRRLVVVSFPHRRSGWLPEVRAGQDGVAGSAEQLRGSPVYSAYAAVAPEPGAFDVLVRRTGELVSTDHDWTDDVRAMTTPTMVVVGDADGVPPSVAAEHFALLGGGQADAGWGGGPPTPHRLAVLPGRTHYDIAAAPELAAVVEPFLAG